MTELRGATAPRSLFDAAEPFQPAQRRDEAKGAQSKLAHGADLRVLRGTCRILVVDDDPSIQMTLSMFLEVEGYIVEAAANGEDALKSIDRQLPTVVLLDMRMPIVDGWAFARAVRARGISVPLVVMTAAQNGRKWADEIDAAAYLAKPFDLSVLLSTLDELCTG